MKTWDASRGLPTLRVARLGAAMIAIAAIVILASCASTRLTSISSFSSSDGGFTVTVPDGSMEETTSSGGEGFTSSVIHKFVKDESGGPRFVVIYGELDQSFVDGKTPAMLLDWAEAGNLSATGGQQVADKQLTISGHPGREQQIVGPLGTYVFRTLLAGDRLYSFSVKGTPPQVGQADVVVFLESITVTP